MPQPYAELVKQLGITVGLPIALALAIWWSLIKLDPVLRKTTRKALADWLLGGAAQPNTAWPGLLCTMFDSLFKTTVAGVKKLRVIIPNFGRSLVASLLAVVISALLFLTILGGDFQFAEFQRSDGATEDQRITLIGILNSQGEYELIGLYAFLLVPVIMNSIIDFLSLIQSRVVLDLIESRYISRGYIDLIGVFIFFLFDILMTTIIVLLCLPFILSMADKAQERIAGNPARAEERVYTVELPEILRPGGFFGLLTPQLVEREKREVVFIDIDDNIRKMSEEDILLPWDYFSNYWEGNGKVGAAGIFVYSTYLTSVWVWSFLVGAILIKLFGANGRLLKTADRVFKVSPYVNKYPLRVVGGFLVACAVVGSIGWQLAAT